MNKVALPVALRNGGRRRMFFALYLLFVAVCTLAFGYMMARGDASYLVGDWLINYNGGFVRRGLMGALVLPMSHATGVPLAAVVFVIQSGAFLFFLACVYRLSKGIRWSYLMVAVLLSPATIAFTVLDPNAGIRKDVLLFAGLALAICAIVSGRLRTWQISLQISVLLSVIAVVLTLSHEALVVGMPYLFAAVAIESGSARRALKICMAPLLLSGAALIAVMLHPENLAIA